jgi:hypothetical protein
MSPALAAAGWFCNSDPRESTFSPAVQSRRKAAQKWKQSALRNIFRQLPDTPLYSRYNLVKGPHTPMIVHLTSIVLLAMGIFALVGGIQSGEFYTGAIARQSKRRIPTWLGKAWFLGFAAVGFYIGVVNWKKLNRRQRFLIVGVLSRKKLAKIGYVEPYRQSTLSRASFNQRTEQ